MILLRGFPRFGWDVDALNFCILQLACPIHPCRADSSTTPLAAARPGRLPLVLRTGSPQQAGGSAQQKKAPEFRLAGIRPQQVEWPVSFAGGHRSPGEWNERTAAHTRRDF